MTQHTCFSLYHFHPTLRGIHHHILNIQFSYLFHSKCNYYNIHCIRCKYWRHYPLNIQKDRFLLNSYQIIYSLSFPKNFLRRSCIIKSEKNCCDSSSMHFLLGPCKFYKKGHKEYIYCFLDKTLTSNSRYILSLVKTNLAYYQIKDIFLPYKMKVILFLFLKSYIWNNTLLYTFCNI